MAKLDWKLAEQLFSEFCTQKEVAAKCGVTLKTLREKCYPDQGKSLAEFQEECVCKGKTSLRSIAYSMAMIGNEQILKRLGDTYLGWSESQKVESTNKVVFYIPDDGRDKIEQKDKE